jgi:hypothetical protein
MLKTMVPVTLRSRPPSRALKVGCNGEDEAEKLVERERREDSEMRRSCSTRVRCLSSLSPLQLLSVVLTCRALAEPGFCLWSPTSPPFYHTGAPLHHA